MDRWKPGQSTTVRALPNEHGVIEHAYVQGGFLVLRMEVLGRIGYLDEEFHTFYEEVDLCRRARWAGYRIAILPDTPVAHANLDISIDRSRRILRKINARHYYFLTEPEVTIPGYLRTVLFSLREDLATAPPLSAPIFVVANILAVFRRVIRLKQTVLGRRHRKKMFGGAQS